MSIHIYIKICMYIHIYIYIYIPVIIRRGFLAKSLTDLNNEEVLENAIMMFRSKVNLDIPIISKETKH
jgi:hypothetical protein